MQTAFFIVIGAIMVTVLFLAFRAIGRGMEARGELKRDGTLEKNKQDPYTFKSIQEDEDDKLLEKLKDKKGSTSKKIKKSNKKTTMKKKR